MRKLGFITALFLLLSLPLAGMSQFGGGASGNNYTFGGGGQNSPIPVNTLNQVLSLAAPSFGYQPAAFIAMYNTCGCITVEQISPNTYLVVYGGLGIQIIIEGNRSGAQSGGSLPTSGPKR